MDGELSCLDIKRADKGIVTSAFLAPSRPRRAQGLTYTSVHATDSAPGGQLRPFAVCLQSSPESVTARSRSDTSGRLRRHP